MTSGAIMPRARVVAHDATSDIAGLAKRVGFTDPFDALVERVRPVTAGSVDALQVAAALEAAGITDRSARVQFGYADVFDLAEEVFRRIGPAADPPRPRPARDRVGELRDIGHGVLYLLPAAAFPVAFGALGRQAVVGVLLAAVLGWVWSGATAWLAYQMLGAGKPGCAGRVLRWSSLQALGVAALAGALAAGATGAGYGLAVLVTAQMAYQMAAAALSFYRCEILLFASMTPAVVAGIWYLAAGAPVLPVAAGLCLASVGLALVAALWQTTRRQDAGDPPLSLALRGKLRPLLPVLAFTALSAAFFLLPQARHLLAGYDIAIASVPVIAGMGVVEWRARLFAGEARALLGRVADPRQFLTRIWWAVLSGLGICLVSVSALAVLLLAVLARAGGLSPAVVVMASAGVLLSGAYYLGFLLANMGRYGWLCGSLLLCASGYAGAVLIGAGGALRDTAALLGATVVLVLLYLAALAGCVGQVARHR